MRDDFADRTEAPTPRRREQFRREGNVARSADLNASTVLIAALLILSIIGPQLVSALDSLLRQSLAVPLDANTPTALFSTSANSVMLVLVPLLIGILAIGAIINLAQIGFPLTLRLPKRKPFTLQGGFRRFLLGLLKLTTIGFITYRLIATRLVAVLTTDHLDTLHFIQLCWQLLLSAAMRLALVLLTFGLIDYAWQRYRLSQQLKMTRREVQEELKQTEGNPKTRQRRRQRARNLFQSPITQSPNHQ